jgi:hypothetical protein
LRDHVRIDARVRTGDEQRERLLAFDEPFEEPLVGGEYVVLKAMNAVY